MYKYYIKFILLATSIIKNLKTELKKKKKYLRQKSVRIAILSLIRNDILCKGELKNKCSAKKSYFLFCFS